MQGDEQRALKDEQRALRIVLTSTQNKTLFWLPQVQSIAPDASILCVFDRTSYLRALAAGADMVLYEFDDGCNLSLSQALAFARAQKISKFVVVSATLDALSALDYLNQGATDCITRHEAWRLTPILLGLADESGVAFSSATHDARYVAAMKRLLRAIQDLSLTRHLDEVTQVVRRAARDISGADGATFVLREGDSCFYADEDAISPLWKGSRFPMQSCVSGYSMLEQKPIVIPDIYCDDRVPVEAYRPTFVKSMVMVPIRQEAPIGAIGNYWAHRHHATQQEVELIQALANATSVAIENVMLYEGLERRVQERTAQLQKLNRELGLTNRELEAFSYSVSHDVRAPLSNIQQLLKICLEYPADKLPAELMELLHDLLENANHATHLTECFVHLARASLQAIQIDDIDLSALASDIAGKTGEQDKQRKIHWTIEPGLKAQGDRQMLYVLLNNLINNAVKYTRKQPAANIVIGHTLHEDRPAFYIRDNGVGFAMEDAGKLFQPFRRLHSAKEFEGSGIGLATVARIVHRHGGEIWAQASPGGGATFYFTLDPMAADTPIFSQSLTQGNQQ